MAHLCELQQLLASCCASASRLCSVQHAAWVPQQAVQTLQDSWLAAQEGWLASRCLQT